MAPRKHEKEARCHGHLTSRGGQALARPDTTVTPLSSNSLKTESCCHRMWSSQRKRFSDGQKSLLIRRRNPQMRERAWKYVTAIHVVDAEYNTAQELLNIPDSWGENMVPWNRMWILSVHRSAHTSPGHLLSLIDLQILMVSPHLPPLLCQGHPATAQ